MVHYNFDKKMTVEIVENIATPYYGELVEKVPGFQNLGWVRITVMMACINRSGELSYHMSQGSQGFAAKGNHRNLVIPAN